MPKASDKISTWQILAAVVSVLITVAMLSVQWQTSIDQIGSLRVVVAELEETVTTNKEEQTAQNRERRDAVAQLESRVAVLESQVKELQK